jgi:radical SAM superfamily enzyme YgiQ (UPF0313 family)
VRAAALDDPGGARRELGRSTAVKILCVNANTNTFLAPIPVGLALVAQNAIDGGHQVHMLDFMWEKDPDALLEDALREHAPSLVAFSLRNVDNQNMGAPLYHVPDYQRWVAIANRHAPTVIGGSAFTSYPHEMMSSIRPTYGIIGQAEKTFGRFVGELEAGARAFETPGVHWWEGGQLRANPGLFDGYAGCGRINWDLIDRRRYQRSRIPSAVITKSGCPYRCLICDVHVTCGPRCIPRDPDEIVDELLENQRRWGLNRHLYKFVDSVFNWPLDWAKTVLEKIISSGLRIGYSATVYPHRVDREFVRLLRRSGCLMVSKMLVSGSRKMLEANRSVCTPDEIATFFECCDREGVPFNPTLLFGLPGETRETVEESIRFFLRYKLMIFETLLGIRINRGTPLYDVAVRDGVIGESESVMSPAFYVEPRLPRQWVRERQRALRRQRGVAMGKWARFVARAMALKLQA